MTFFQNILSDLVEKKLWPVAAILVALLVAVPMTLAKPGEPTATATLPPVSADADTGPELALTRTAMTGFGRAPRVNDKRLDPFGPRTTKAFDAALKKFLAGADTVIDEAAGGGGIDTGSGGGTVDGGGGGGVATPPADEPKASTPDEPKPTTPETEEDDLLTVLVTSGETEPTEITGIRTLSPLPDTENPFLVYVGRAGGDDKVSFLVSADAIHSGDGVCAPTPTDCRTLTMGIGDTADFTLVNKENAKVSVTVTDVETEDVVVTGDEDSEDAAQLEAETRAIGAKALKSVIRDEDVLKSLVKQGVKLRV